ncbi:CART protein, partial [Chauna torquata]|nr:CART protein [Chauna torquata]
QILPVFLSLCAKLMPRRAVLLRVHGGDAGGARGDGAVAQVEALQEVLEKLRSRELPAAAKKLGRVPSCQPREPCAVRMGARIGKRCSCPPGTACNLYVLRCS